MKRLVVVSNRVAVPDGTTRAGGLAVALQEALQQNGGIWFGWSGKISAQTPSAPQILEEGPVTFATLDLSRRDHAEYYNGYANRTLWPIFHYRLGLADFNRENYTGYLRVNTLFAHQLFPLLREDDDIWVHDYHLIPMGEELRRLGVRQRMGFFLHTPFPAMEILLALPGHDRIARSLCAYDVVGFQTENDLRAFHDYITLEARGEVLSNGMVQAFGRTLKAEVFPIGIDVDIIVDAAENSDEIEDVQALKRRLRDCRLIIGVDRLDYSKGLAERFKAFGNLLEHYPQWRGKVSLMQIAPPSRSDVPEYLRIRRNLEALAGHINGRFAQVGWTPLHYLNSSFERNVLAGFYRNSQACLITPLRDGMNLVAKEYVASQNPDDPGVLVLSRFAGAARELHAALLVNPYDEAGVAEAINAALSMHHDERRERWSDMMRAVRNSSLDRWRESFLSALRQAPYSVEEG
ncbi:alpha,alpha-trehalose-phosphate synthase (UDP-forming) [Telmatospirillum sp. J64-1]|uniref:alpha,alpha-trehalose-phosphate synthase (UDP-forming) n=1 Tax=Telmatospirillum sp. J64-1 TaxID=2502183 RepID=UPI00115F3A55|nr:alpha,alpha-trehalose-phosphate synthase (UDP-forming) [Telmatospirillum sp. J64-1]